MSEDLIVWAVIGLGVAGIIFVSRHWGGGDSDMTHLHHRDHGDSSDSGDSGGGDGGD